jgi:YbbR domain-containing protein
VIDLLTRNAGWKLFALAVSVVLWFTYASDPEIGAFVSAPVEFRGMADDLEIGSDMPASVSIDVRGPSEQVSNFNAVKSPVMLDFSSIQKPGEETFQIDENSIHLPARMRLERAVPAQIRLQFERRTQQNVPVKVRFAGAAPPGYRVASYLADPAELTVVGPESHVKKTEYAETDPVDLSSVVGESQFRVNAFVSDPHVRFEDPSRITVKVIMEKTKAGR